MGLSAMTEEHCCMGIQIQLKSRRFHRNIKQGAESDKAIPLVTLNYSGTEPGAHGLKNRFTTS